MPPPWARGYDAALFSLDLAILYAQEGQTAELKRLAACGLKRPGSLSPKSGKTSLKLGSASPKWGKTSLISGNCSPKLGKTSPKLGNPSPKLGNASPKLGNASPILGN